MKSSEIELPSNKKFGYFFTLIFTSVSIYFFINSILSWAILFNKLWMRFGLLLGQIISPLVLGIIFFGIFTPVAFLMRLSGRDELRLKFKNKTSYWILRNEPIQGDSFRRQY